MCGFARFLAANQDFQQFCRRKGSNERVDLEGVRLLTDDYARVDTLVFEVAAVEE